MPSSQANLESLAGKRVVLTGATAGIGQAAAEAFAEAGADLLLVARNPERAKRTSERLRARRPECRVDLVLADLSSQKQIRRAADEILTACPQIDVLFNNAGLVTLQRSETEDGIESTFAVNHLAYFLLTNLLVPRLRETPRSRIVLTASDAHRFGGALDFDDLGNERDFRGMRVYGRSKCANILYTRELGRRLADSDVTVNCFHPGMVRSELGTSEGLLGRVAQKVIWPFARTAAKGAETGVYLSTSPEVEGQSGGYYFDCKPHEAKPFAQDDESARRLWEESVRMTGYEGAV
jgi:NAD(P)-dependent dehydrogenase (short-subunit alcohol dehydrogenase family)